MERFVEDGFERYERALRNEFEERQTNIDRQLCAARDQSEKERLSKEKEKLISDFNRKLENAKHSQF